MQPKDGKAVCVTHSATVSVRPSDANTDRPLSSDTFQFTIFGVGCCGMGVEDFTGQSVGGTSGATALWSAPKRSPHASTAKMT